MADDTGTKIVVVASALVALGVMFAALADTPRLCTPGQQRPCTCPDVTVSGVQRCASDGLSYEACSQCPAALASAGEAAPAAGEAKAPAPAAAPETVPTCDAKLGALKVSNHKLVGPAVLAELAKAETALGTCCAATPASSRPAAGLARVVVGRDGKVANVLNAGRGAAATLPACALDAFRGLDFAVACKPAGAKCNAATVIDVPVSFASN